MENNIKNCSICCLPFTPKQKRQNVCSFSCRQEKVRLVARGRKRGVRYGISILNARCEICGYSETVDVYHEGSDLFILCPNHHALITRGIKTLKQLIRIRKV